MGAPVNQNRSSTDLHKKETGSPTSSILVIFLLIAVIGTVLYLFKDQIIAWKNKNKNSEKPNEIKPAETTTEPETNSNDSFELQQPELGKEG